MAKIDLSVFNGVWKLVNESDIQSQLRWENGDYQMTFSINIFNQYGQGWVVRKKTTLEQYFAIKTNGSPWQSGGEIIYANILRDIPSNLNVQIKESGNIILVDSFINNIYQFSCIYLGKINIKLAYSSSGNSVDITCEAVSLPNGLTLKSYEDGVYLQGIINNTESQEFNVTFNYINQTNQTISKTATIKYNVFYPITLQALQENAVVSLNSTNNSNSISYITYNESIDSNWSDYTNNQQILLPNIGDKVSFICSGQDLNEFKFYTGNQNNGQLKVSGNPNSLYNYSDKCLNLNSLFKDCINIKDASSMKLQVDSLIESCYANMFSGCTSLINPPSLPSTTLATSCYEGMFSDCTALVTAPELPAEKLTTSCYASMFSGCTSLIQAPTLSATTLATSCYNGMFRGCTSLKTVSTLPATTLVDSCYESMFSDCTSLVQAPKLPATTLATSCYEDMFSGCVNLKSTPILSSKLLAQSCYEGMFSGCSSLQTVTELPAQVLVTSCYKNMFSGCTLLIKTPKLLSTSLAQSCYDGMFSNCTNLVQLSSRLICNNLKASCYANMFSGCSSFNKIQIGFTDWLKDNIQTEDIDETATLNWLKGVSESGTFVKPVQLEELYGASYIPIGWQKKLIQFFTLQNENCNSSISLNIPEYSGDDMQLYYKTNNTDWEKYQLNQVINLNNNQYVKFQSLKAGDFNFNNNGYHVKIENVSVDNDLLKSGVKALGNIQSLLNYSESCYDYCYKNMFKDCIALIQAPSLPATTLATSCYEGMFSGCSNLMQSPSLSVMELIDSCYANMFNGCTSLQEAPVLKAQTLNTNSCYQMFYNCSLLNYIEVDFNNWHENATTDWVYGVANVGTFKKKSSLNKEFNNSRIPENWEVVGTPFTLSAITEETVSINRIGYLPDLKLLYSLDNGENWNEYVFDEQGKGEVLTINENISLQIKNQSVILSLDKDNYVNFNISGNVEFSGDIQALLKFQESCNDYCYYNLFNQCKGILNAPELSVSKLGISCYENMFKGCEGLKNAPKLISETLVDSCYKNMFSGCTALETAPELPAITLAKSCYEGMFKNCENLINITSKLPAINLTPSCYASMFEGCRKLQKSPAIMAQLLINNGSCRRMFYGCSSLNYIQTQFNNWDNANSTQNWVYGVAKNGQFKKTRELPEQFGVSYIPENWTVALDNILIEGFADQLVIVNTNIIISDIDDDIVSIENE